MKRLLFTGLALAAASAYGALNTATGDLLTDYTAWFAPEFKIASDANYVGVPYPSANIPNATAMDIPGVRDWTGWSANWGASGLKATSAATPFFNDPTVGKEKFYIEVVFLGETAGWWDDFGYTKNGVDTLLADSVQTINKNGPKNRWFGDNLVLTLAPGETLDFFVTGSGVYGPNVDPLAPTVGTEGGKYYAFDTDANQPIGSDMQSYFGILDPISSVRDKTLIPGVLDPFFVFAFEDIRERGSGRDSDYNDFIFALRATYDTPQAPVPEPSTYGLIGAAALLALVGYRRFRKV